MVNLGIPLGTEAYVQRKVCDSVRGHDERLRCLVALAQHTGSATRAGGRNIGRMCARIGLQYSALARNVHFLRSIPERLGAEGAALHDRGVMMAFAAAYEQLSQCGRVGDCPGGGRMVGCSGCDVVFATAPLRPGREEAHNYFSWLREGGERTTRGRGSGGGGFVARALQSRRPPIRDRASFARHPLVAKRSSCAPPPGPAATAPWRKPRRTRYNPPSGPHPDSHQHARTAIVVHTRPRKPSLRLCRATRPLLPPTAQGSSAKSAHCAPARSTGDQSAHTCDQCCDPQLASPTQCAAPAPPSIAAARHDPGPSHRPYAAHKPRYPKVSQG